MRDLIELEFMKLAKALGIIASLIRIEWPPMEEVSLMKR